MTILEIILMVGLPRSGKSTWIKTNQNNHVVVSPDRIRKVVFGTQFFLPVEPFVWATAKSMARLLLEQGKSIIVDATNLSQGERWQWQGIADEYNADIRCVVFETPIEECLRRNETCPIDEKVPVEVIERMNCNYFPPVNDGIDYSEIEVVKYIENNS